MLLYSYFKSLFLHVCRWVSHYDRADQISREKQKDKRSYSKEIGTKCYQFGVLLLKDETGARIETVIRKHLNDAEQSNTEIFKPRFAGEGEQPVTWEH